MILAHSKVEQTSLAAYDRIAQELQNVKNMLTQSESEIKRLKELCEKNKIDTTPPKPTKK